LSASRNRRARCAFTAVRALAEICGCKSSRARWEYKQAFIGVYDDFFMGKVWTSSGLD
jgi:hypothetical protein